MRELAQRRKQETNLAQPPPQWSLPILDVVVALLSWLPAHPAHLICCDMFLCNTQKKTDRLPVRLTAYSESYKVNESKVYNCFLHYEGPTIRPLTIVKIKTRCGKWFASMNRRVSPWLASSCGLLTGLSSSASFSGCSCLDLPELLSLDLFGSDETSGNRFTLHLVDNDHIFQPKPLRFECIETMFACLDRSTTLHPRGSGDLK